MIPKIGAELYHRFLDEWLYADEEGLDIQINEHHQTPTCVDPAAPIVLGILARQTKRARLLILGNPIGNRTQPVRVAEEMAMVDVLSRGRVECGFVRSVPYEIAAGNSNPVRLRERMCEALDLIVKAWTTHDGPFSFEGEFFHHRMVNIWPRPYQQPHPPIWIASTSHHGVGMVGETRLQARHLLRRPCRGEEDLRRLSRRLAPRRPRRARCRSTGSAMPASSIPATPTRKAAPAGRS